MNTLKLKLLVSIIALIILIPFSGNGQENEAYIYGTILTHSGEEYTGFMRWGKEEMFWHDIFNSEKLPNSKHKKKAAEKSKGKWSNFNWNFRSIWEDKYRQTPHTFACFFGDIHKLNIYPGSKVELILKNGESIHLVGGSNDIGTKINLDDYELGMINFSWSKIKQIDFFQAPSGVKPPSAEPLYGKLKTKRNGVLIGYVKWDMDERCTEDILDGNSKHGDQKIPFKNILAITKNSSGADITFQSGRTIYVDNSNDVDSGNRGIEIYEAGIGSRKVHWSDFVELEFINANDLVSYNNFKHPEGIKAEVLTLDGNHHEGLIVFDIDEAWEMEFLDGNDDNIEYQIPIRNISKIRPKNKSYSMIYLKNGDNLFLGDKQDVSYNNDGILVFTRNNKDPKYIAWENIDEILIK